MSKWVVIQLGKQIVAQISEKKEKSLVTPAVTFLQTAETDATSRSPSSEHFSKKNQC